MAIGQRNFFETETLSRETLDFIVESNGQVPDLFVEPYERAGTGPGPNGFTVPDTPESRTLLERIDAEVDGLITKRSAGHGERPADL